MSKICTNCDAEKPLDAYRLSKDASDGHRGDCRSCENRYSADYRSTLKGCVTTLLASAKKHAATRKEKRTDQSGEFTLVRKDLFDIWENQKGLCFYSGIPLSLNGCWKISLERLDQTQGYVKSNAVLCCLELNTASQWSHKKIQEMLAILDEDVKSNDVNFDKKEGRKKAEKVQRQNIGNVLHYRCNVCKIFLTTDAFRKNMYSFCRQCEKNIKKLAYETPRASLQQLVSNAKSHTEQRIKRNNKHHDNTFDIDFDFLVALYKKQKGLCAYSGLPLHFGIYNDINWTTSLERIDACKGYVKTNVCLICFEFQATEISVKMNECQGNMTGWNKEKFNLFKDTVVKKLSFEGKI